MSDWTAGYVADIGYTYGYYTELNPLRVRLAFLKAGLVPPEVGTCTAAKIQNPPFRATKLSFFERSVAPTRRVFSS